MTDPIGDNQKKQKKNTTTKNQPNIFFFKSVKRAIPFNQKKQPKTIFLQIS